MIGAISTEYCCDILINVSLFLKTCKKNHTVSEKCMKHKILMDGKVQGGPTISFSKPEAVASKRISMTRKPCISEGKIRPALSRKTVTYHQTLCSYDCCIVFTRVKATSIRICFQRQGTKGDCQPDK